MSGNVRSVWVSTYRRKQYLQFRTQCGTLEGQVQVCVLVLYIPGHVHMSLTEARTEQTARKTARLPGTRTHTGVQAVLVRITILPSWD